MSSNPGQVELWMLGTSVQSRTKLKIEFSHVAFAGFLDGLSKLYLNVHKSCLVTPGIVSAVVLSV